MGRTTEERPKCMAQLGGRPLIAWQLAALSQAGAANVAVVRGYMGNVIDAPGAEFIDNPRWRDTNMVASLMCAGHWLAAEGGIVSYGDIFYGPEAVRRLRHAGGDVAITYDENWLELWSRRFDDPLSDAETFTASADGTLLEIGRKPASLDQVKGQYMGLLSFTKKGWERTAGFVRSLPSPESDKMDMTTLLNRLMETGAEITTAAVSGGWGEVDSEDDLRLYEKLLAEGDFFGISVPTR